MKIKPIEWTDEQPPNESCSYNHVCGKTPLFKFQITWKGWKENPSFSVEIGRDSYYEWYAEGVDLDDAKRIANDYYTTVVNDCIDIEVQGCE